MTQDAESPGAQLAAAAHGMPRAARVRVGIGAAILLVLAALAVAVGVAMFRPQGGEVTVPAVSARTHDTSADGPAVTATPTARYVHVLGAVAHPGLYLLSDGARVVDAIAAAGGFRKDAEQGGVNLARVIGDGEQLIVPVVGQAPPAGAAGGAAPGGTAGTPGGRINLNTADEAALETLPRVGPALAQRIIDWRTTNGRFASVQDLTNVTGIGEKIFDGLKDLVTV